MEGWPEEQILGRMDLRLDRWMNRRTYGSSDEETDVWKMDEF